MTSTLHDKKGLYPNTENVVEGGISGYTVRYINPR